jgi:hypothetical protein
VRTDVPITAVFLALFIAGAAANMTILQRNRRRAHKFLLSGLLFGFCMARCVACALRIAWATRARHAPLAIAAQVFVSAGVVLLFVANLIFAQRVVRAARSAVGWHPLFARAFVALFVLIGATLAVVIAATVHSFYTLDARARRVDRALQLYGGTVFTVVAALPLLLLAVALLPPRRRQQQHRPEKFGSGRWRTKVLLLAAGALLLTLGAAFRTGTAYRTPRPPNRPAWYHSRACFYVFNFGVELVVLYLYTFSRVDRRFHVPDGASGPGQYAAGASSSSTSSSPSSSPEALAAAAAAAAPAHVATTAAAPIPLPAKDDHNSSGSSRVLLEQKEIV